MAYKLKTGLLAGSALLLFQVAVQSQHSQTRPENNSNVPYFTFPATLEQQEEALKANPLMQRFAESRQALSIDPHRPVYHFVNPESRLNDPNGFTFWNGNWHLFYQAYPPDDPRQHWGHAVSRDLVHWRDLPLAIYPGPERASYSGNIHIEENRAIAHYHGLGVGNMVAVSNDPLLLNWEKLGDDQPVIPKRNRDTYLHEGKELPHHVYDPFIWEEDGLYYSLSGWRHRDEQTGRFFATAELYSSPDLVNWEYMHQFIEGDLFTVAGTDAACPYFLPIGDDQYIFLFISHYYGFGGAQYWLGDYDREAKKFHPTHHGYFNHGAIGPGGVIAPSATSDGKGGVIVMFNIFSGMSTPGWDQLMSLPMRLSVEDRNRLHMEPAGDIQALRNNHISLEKKSLPANEEIVLDQLNGNAMELMVEIDPKQSQHVEINVLRSPDKREYTRIAFYPNRRFWDSNGVLTINSDYSSILPQARTRPAENAPLQLNAGETLKLRIFIDKSVVEVYANDRQYAAIRVYPGLENSTGVSLMSRGSDSELISLDAWQMQNVWDLSLEQWYQTTVWR